MTLWFVFALMTVAAVFAVLWPLSRSSARVGQRPRLTRLQGPARRDRSRCRSRADRVFRSRGGAHRDRRRLLAAVRPSAIGRQSRIEPRPAPRPRPSWRWWRCDRAWRSIRRSDRRALGDFPLASRARACCARYRAARQLVAQVEAHLEKPDRRPRLGGAGAGSGAARPLRRRGPRLSQFDHLQRRRPSATLRSRRSAARGGWRRDGGGQGRVRARRALERR